jgi:hypothetical protein
MANKRVKAGPCQFVFELTDAPESALMEIDQGDLVVPPPIGARLKIAGESRGYVVDYVTHEFVAKNSTGGLAGFIQRIRIGLRPFV